MVRARVFEDEGNCSLSCEYRVMQTGKYRLNVLHASSHVPGSPFTVVAKAGVGGLKDWKASRQREAASDAERAAAERAEAAGHGRFVRPTRVLRTLRLDARAPSTFSIRKERGFPSA